MENRFAFKDLVLFLLLVILILLVLAAMKQFDRQWEDVQSVQKSVRELTAAQARTQRQIHALQALIEQGVTVTGTAPATGNRDDPAKDSFHRLRSAQAHEDWAQGDWLISSFRSNVPAITPLVQKDLYGRTIQDFVLEPLVKRDADTLEWLPHIAVRWEIEDHSEAWRAYMEKTRARLEERVQSDPSLFRRDLEQHLKELENPPAPGSAAHVALETKARASWIDARITEDPGRPPAMAVTFHLRRDVVFSDGEPLTAHDVVFSWELLKNSAIDAEATRNFYDNIETYEAPDDHTVRFTMSAPHYLAFGMVAGRPILPRHFYRRYTPQEINETPGLLLGSGPYQMENPTSWTPGDPLTLWRNERYWGEPHTFERLDWKIISNDVARLTEFQKGAIDLLGPTPEQFQKLSTDPKILKRAVPYATDQLPAGYMFMAWNQRRQGEPTLFAQKEVRQAMTYLSERRRLCQEVMFGYATVANGPYPPGSPQADPDIEARHYDVAKARALLKEAGFEDRDDDGVLEDRAGNPFRYKLTYSPSSNTIERLVLFLKDSYARAGIVMELDPLEWSVFTERIDSRAFDAIILRWGGGAIEGDIRQMFHSSQIEGRANNFTSYVNVELDALIDEARQTIDEPQRMKLWHACHRILWEDQPYTFMSTSKALTFIDKRIRNVQEITTGLNPRAEWYVPLPMQKRH